MFDDADLPNLDETLGQPASQQAWRRRYMVGGLTAVLVVAVLLATYGAGLSQQIFPARSTFSVTVRSNVSWGQVTLRYAGQDHHIALDQAIRLPEGTQPYQVLLGLQAAPFMPRSCTFTVPLVESDSCLAEHVQILEAGNQQGQLAQANGLLLTFGFALADLPASQRTPLLQWVAAQVTRTTPQVMLPAGAHYPVGQIFRTVHVALTPLVATLVALPVVSVGHITTCADLCPPEDDAIVSTTVGDAWQVRLFVDLSWAFRRASDGLEVGANVESVSVSALAFTLVFQPSSDQWAFASPIGPILNQALQNQLCQDGRSAIESLFLSAGTNISQLDNHLRQVQDHHLAGCLLQVRALQGNASAEFLWQVGQLYTANAFAQQVEQNLPAANAQDLGVFASGQ